MTFGSFVAPWDTRMYSTSLESPEHGKIVFSIIKSVTPHLCYFNFLSKNPTYWAGVFYVRGSPWLYFCKVCHFYCIVHSSFQETCRSKLHLSIFAPVQAYTDWGLLQTKNLLWYRDLGGSLSFFAPSAMPRSIWNKQQRVSWQKRCTYLNFSQLLILLFAILRNIGNICITDFFSLQILWLEKLQLKVVLCF